MKMLFAIWKHFLWPFQSPAFVIRESSSIKFKPVTLLMVLSLFWWPRHYSDCPITISMSSHYIFNGPVTILMVASLRALGGPLGGPLVILAIFSSLYGYLNSYLRIFNKNETKIWKINFAKKWPHDFEKCSKMKKCMKIP